MTVTLKQSSYGIGDYRLLRLTGKACVDKTQYIERLEATGHPYPFLVRPRRFGKTLFTQILKLYYDKAEAARFEENFGGTYIADHKTPLANHYYVLTLDMSAVNSSNFAKGLCDSLKNGMRNFCDRYAFPEGERILSMTFDTPQELMGEFCRAFSGCFKGKIYLIIDEYDQTANNVLSNDVESFRALTRSGGVLKEFFSYLKQLTTNGPLERIFLTGVTAISLDSMTSGFSIAKNFSTRADFAGMYGFTEEELRTLIPQLVNVKKLSMTEDDLVARMREWYNGYRFSPRSAVTVFNASMCLYYLDYLASEEKEPLQLMDPAVAQDLSKIEKILALGRPEFVEEVVEQAVRGERIPFDGGLTLLNLQNSDYFTDQAVLSALFYLGFLTYVPGEEEELVVPNRAIAQQFYDYRFKTLRRFTNWVVSRRFLDKTLAPLAAGNPEPWLREAERLLTKQCGIQKSLHLSESDFQVCLLTLANLMPDYTCRAEVEVTGETHGYADLLLTSESGTKPSYLIELKYLTKKNGTAAAVKKTLEAAAVQVADYILGDNLCSVPRLVGVAAVFVGTELSALRVMPAAAEFDVSE